MDNEHPIPYNSGHSRWLYVVVALVAVVAVLPVVLSLKQLSDGLKLKNVTAYSQLRYFPEKATLCPGDTMIFTPTLHVTLAPVIVEVSGTWWDENEPQHTAITGKKGDTSISIFRDNKDVTRAIKVPVPQLPPGDYSYLRATESSSGSRPGITSVLITIPPDCPAVSTGP